MALGNYLSAVRYWDPFRKFKSWTRRFYSDWPSVASLNQQIAYLQELMRQHPPGLNSFLSDGSLNYTGEPADVKRDHRKNLAEPYVKAPFWSKIWAVASQDFAIIPRNRRNKLEQQACKFARHSIESCYGGLRGIVEGISIGALLDGWSLCEKVFDIERDDPEWRGKWVLKHFKPKDVNFLRLIVDPYNNVVGIYGNVNATGEVYHPKDFVRFSYQSLYGSPIGISDMRAADRAVRHKLEIMKLRILYLEKFVGPFLVGKYTQEQEREVMLAALAEARARGYIAIPATDEIDSIDLATQSNEQFNATLDDLNKEILIAIRFSHLDMAEGMRTDARGDTEVQKTVSELPEWALSNSISTVINEQMMPDLIYPNFGKIALPRFQFGGINQSDILKDLEVDKALRELGVPLSLSDVYERSQRTPPTNPADALTAPLPQPGMPGQQPGMPQLPAPYRFTADIADPSESDAGDALESFVAGAGAALYAVFRPVVERALSTKELAISPDELELLKREVGSAVGSAQQMAVDYVSGLLRVEGVSLPPDVRPVTKDPFTLAVTTSQTVLESVQREIQARIDSGLTEGSSQAVEDILRSAGISPANPQYAEMVFRTNFVSAYNEALDSMKGHQWMRAEFPAWVYLAIRDGRERPHHGEKDGRYYPASVRFEDVRGTDISDVANCRCTFALIHRSEWESLAGQGVRLAA